MSILGKIFEVTIDVIEIPVAVVKDVVTLGGVLEDEPEPYTVKKLKDVKKDLIDL